MSRLAGFALFTAVCTLALAQPAPPSEEAALYERGRQQARAAIRRSWIRQGIADPDPMLLYQEGQAHAASGKKEAALLAFETLMNLYPASEYARKAKDAAARLHHRSPDKP